MRRYWDACLRVSVYAAVRNYADTFMRGCGCADSRINVDWEIRRPVDADLRETGFQQERIYVTPYIRTPADKDLRMLVISVLNLKGGSTKTTTAAFLAHALHEAGMSVLGVDADGENESLLSWQAAGDWPFPVIGMPVANLHRQLPGIAGEKYDVVVIDTPPMKEQRSIVLSAARLATHIVCPMAPTQMEYSRLPAMAQLLEEVTDLRDGDRPLFAVLFTRTVSNAASTAAFRQLVEDDGFPVLKPTVGRLERFAQAYGSPISNALNTAYGDAANELFALTGSEVA